MGRPSERKGYVYVLHFERPLAHAQHYVGCTTDLRARLVAHAQGRGGKIVAEASRQGIRFKLGALGETTVAAMRRLERQTKNWHGAAPLCECCTPAPRAIPGTRPFPIALIQWPLWSDELALLAPQPEVPTCRVTSDADSFAVLSAMKRLMQLNKDCLGFIPVGGDGGLTLSIIAGRVIVAEADRQIVGFLAWTENPDSIQIQQCVVSDAWRRCGVGRSMLAELAAQRPGKSQQCKVRDDLAANEFWRGCGFTLCGHHTHETSAAQLNQYRKDVF